jgi:hypothetical protein
MLRWLLSKNDRLVLDMLDRPGYVVAFKGDDGLTLTEVSFRGNYRTPPGFRQRDKQRRTYRREALP